jgi:hypothetical protein
VLRVCVIGSSARSGVVFMKEARLALLIDALHSSTSCLQPDARHTLASTVGRLLNSASGDVVGGSVARLLQPFVGTISHCTSKDALCEHLTTLSHALRCLDSSGILTILVPFVTSLWPLLTSVVTAHCKSVEIVAAAFEVTNAVVKRSMLGVAGFGLISSANDLIRTALAHGSPESVVPAVACIGTMISALYDAISRDVYLVLAGTFRSCCELAFASPADTGPLIASVFDVASSFIPFHSACPLPVDVLQLLFHRAPSLLFGQPAETQQAVAYFITVCARQCSSMTYDVGGAVQTSEAFVSGQIPTIVPALVKCVVDGSQPRSLDFLATAVAACVKAFPQPCMACIPTLFADGGFSGSAVAGVPEGVSLATIVAAVFAAVPAHADEAGHEVPFLCDFFCDFGDVCHGKAAAAVLQRFL